LQAKLLRFLEERIFRRVGGTNELTVDVRIIAATNRDIDKAIQEGKFRGDLFYRLDVISVPLPPLRERGDDVKLLARHFAERFARDFRKPVTGIDEEADRKLQAYDWPGNVRELRNAIERAVLLARSDVIGPDDLVLGSAARKEHNHRFILPDQGLDLHKLENDLIQQALARAGNNQTRAAKLLHLTRDALRYRLEKMGLL
jgi:transcriptional regulator with PAS, ATPase and Fis domain